MGRADLLHAAREVVVLEDHVRPRHVLRAIRARVRGLQDSIDLLHLVAVACAPAATGAVLESELRPKREAELSKEDALTAHGSGRRLQLRGRLRISQLPLDCSSPTLRRKRIAPVLEVLLEYTPLSARRLQRREPNRGHGRERR